MCGRFTQRYTWEEVQAFLNLTGPALNLRPRYNVAPSQEVAVVRTSGDGRSLSMLRWGLIPSWAREPNIGYKLINARAETASAKPSFQAAWRAGLPDPGRRLLRVDPPGRGEAAVAVRAEGRRAVRLRRAMGALDGTRGDGVHGIARRMGAGGEAIETCTILTTAANATVARIHNRMPVILPPDAFAPWLSGEAVPLGPYPADAMTAHPVSTLVNRPANDDPRCVEPVAA